MKLLLYLNETNGYTDRFRAAIDGLAADRVLEVCPDIASLARRLRKRRGDLTVVVLYASTREELTDIIALADWLIDLRILIVLPDRERDTISQGLTLRPRFFSFTDTDFADVSDVLGKMLKIYGKESPERWQQEVF